ncbi:hypothetical protein PFICI_03580 [Pestalotiopsis fici W106-1]|uniref:LCCL domain-containing protein n=1 Tax=Pestalotiopsis fici (strain W106-1 / CGMCC3.15140) TaxID=1229662 RepID=W3XHQ0_PESFW|nr:uncharacterized protein PFICI_03580 [Pestalotiopsis fici W106-1]ETS85555.1 hypothetical protein PFICI_03580 [Pestalotiopsis fici W106-1]
MSNKNRGNPRDAPVHVGLPPIEPDHSANGHDEEAQLLITEEFEYFEHDGLPTPQTRRRTRLARWPKDLGKPRKLRIEPWFPIYQRYPLTLMEHFLTTSWARSAALTLFLLSWLIAFFVPLYLGTITLQDQFGQNVLNLDCVDSPWEKKNVCGLDGIDCRPFSNTSFAFRCPASCLGVQVLNPHAVGPLDVNYQALVVGDASYRGDSFICGAAIHAGIITDSEGGCGRLTYIGQVDTFESSWRNGIESIPFDSYFPLSFQFSSDQSVNCTQDPRRLLLAVSILFTIVLSLFTSSPSLHFGITFTGIFAHVSLVSDPPSAAFHNTTVLPDRISIFAGRFLPAAFIAFVLYRTCITKALEGLEAQVEKTLFWLGAFWIGALSNYTFDWIPIQRLTADDLEKQPGAKLALAIIVTVIVIIATQQIYCFFLERRLLRYLGLYGLFLVGLLACFMIPGVELRLHHYIYALLLLPGTSVQTRSSLLYQGLLLGLFVNGAARWGFASILQTSEALRGDGLLRSNIPSIYEPTISSMLDKATISIAWMTEPSAIFDAISVLVNDVERYRGDIRETTSTNFTWERPATLAMPEYFRFAFIRDGQTLDYSSAGTWFPNGTWYMRNTTHTKSAL